MFSRKCIDKIFELERFVSPRYNGRVPVILKRKEVPKSKIWYTIEYDSIKDDIIYTIVN